MPNESVIRVPAFEMPLSSYLSPKTRAALLRWTREVDTLVKACPYKEGDIANQRRYWDERLAGKLVTRFRSRYAVRMAKTTVAGVRVDVMTPIPAIPARNKTRVLINLHGGGFLYGAQFAGLIESIPTAALGKIKVIGVDYRMAPEFAFPAATDDVLAVYRALLKTYRARNIGIYGCSAGALLTAQTVARLIKQRLPLPGAIGMLFGAADFWSSGDTGHLRPIFAGAPLEPASRHPYFLDVKQNDPLAFPLRSPKTMARFPPTLLISATRDHALSSVVQTHACLAEQDVGVSLRLWEGLGHAFIMNPDLAATREVHAATAKFFAERLGAS